MVKMTRIPLISFDCQVCLLSLKKQSGLLGWLHLGMHESETGEIRLKDLMTDRVLLHNEGNPR